MPPHVKRYELNTIDVLLAGKRVAVDINLTDRRHMLFPMLLGRTALEGRFAVDPALSYTQPRPVLVDPMGVS